MQKILCLDVGGTSIKSAIYQTDGKLLETFESVATNASEIKLGETILKVVKERLALNSGVSGIAIASAGVIDSDAGKVIYSGYTIPNYTETEIKKTVESLTGLPCEVENDANCAGLAEMWQGAGQDYQSGVCLTVGTGVGGAVIINGQLVKGRGFTAGEVGYMPVNGQNFQDVASTTSLIARVNQLSLEKAYQSGEEIFKAAKEGNRECVQGIDELITNLATGISIIMYLLNPDVIVLGGGIMAQKDYLHDKLMKRVSETIIDRQFATSAIVFAEHQNNAGMVGALYQFNNKNSR